jgi:alkanesulfonate monooxygenase SsuD/methylene tetrahydromethanopterin reductase-like flavin-dependent oxidoreductase (luciferase family)
MRIGISVSSSHQLDDPREGIRYMVERASAAESAGLDSLFLGDHHATSFAYYQNNPAMGRLLAEWGERPFGALYLLPLWHPLLLAEQVATLAATGKGRFIMQCGLGDHRQGRRMGIDMDRRVGLFEASLSTLRALWRGETVNESRYWQLEKARIAPLPPDPVEVWVGALAPAAIRRAARLAEGWLAAPNLVPTEAAEAVLRYREACEEFSRVPTAVAIRRDVCVGASAEDARRMAKPYLDAGYRGIDRQALLIGDVAGVSEQVASLRDSGYTDVIVRNISSDQGQALATIERLGEVRTLLSQG